MASGSSKREELVRFLDRKVFDPVLRKREDDFSGGQKQKFQDVKRSTENEKNRFHHQYGSAEDVKNNYLSDLSSSAGKKKTSELEELGLPSLPQVKQEFIELCERLGV